MKTSTLFFGAAVIAATSVMALPYSASPYQMSKRQFSSSQVIASINAWINNVDNVNSFLDTAANDTPPDLLSAAETALNNAQDEPIQLSILENVGGLSSDGQNAATLLNEVFGNVITQLNNIINDPSDPDVVNTALEVINNTRCLDVLPAVTTLWAAAAAAAGAPPPPAAQIPASCNGISKK